MIMSAHMKPEYHVDVLIKIEERLGAGRWNRHYYAVWQILCTCPKMRRPRVCVETLISTQPPCPPLLLSTNSFYFPN